MTPLKAIFFDQDGVIIDTERDGHRVSFNMTFKDFGFTDEWSVECYHELLQIAGGKVVKHAINVKTFQLDDSLLERVNTKTKMIVVNSPMLVVGRQPALDDRR